MSIDRVSRFEVASAAASALRHRLPWIGLAYAQRMQMIASQRCSACRKLRVVYDLQRTQIT